MIVEKDYSYDEWIVMGDGYLCPKCGLHSVYENKQGNYKYICQYKGCTFQENVLTYEDAYFN